MGGVTLEEFEKHKAALFNLLRREDATRLIIEGLRR